MAGGGIVSVEQDPEKKDRYLATTAGGETLAFHGEPGRSLFDRYSGATADLGGTIKRGALKGAVGAIPGLGPLASLAVGNESKSDAAPPPIQEGPPAAATTPQAAAPMPAAAPEAPQAAPPPGPQPQAPPQTGPLGYSMEADVGGRKVTGPAIMTPEGVRVFVPGTKGSPGGLTAMGKQTLAQMTETERTIAEARQREDAAREEGALAAREAAAKQAAYQDEAEIQAFARAQEIDTDIQEMERKLKDKDIAHAKAEAMFTESRVDPDRYMKGNWLATLGMAFGAFGASLGKTPNFAQEFVQNRIAQDIRAQELAIDLKGKHADNALVDLKAQTGSLAEAKTAYEQFMTKASAAKFQALALRATNAGDKAKNEEIAANLMGKYALMDQERKIRNQEKIWGERMYYRQGVAGTSGGFVVPTQSSFKTLSEEGRQNEELRLKQAADAKAAAEGKGGGPPVVGERTDKIASFANSARAADSIMKELDRRGVSGDAYDDPTGGLVDKARNREGNELLKQQTMEMSKGLQVAFGKSDRDAEDALKLAAGGGSGRDRYKAAERTKAKVVQGLRTELATLPPAQQQTLLSTLPPDVKKAVLGQK